MCAYSGVARASVSSFTFTSTSGNNQPEGLESMKIKKPLKKTPKKQHSKIFKLSEQIGCVNYTSLHCRNVEQQICDIICRFPNLNFLLPYFCLINCRNDSISMIHLFLWIVNFISKFYSLNYKNRCNLNRRTGEFFFFILVPAKPGHSISSAIAQFYY